MHLRHRIVLACVLLSRNPSAMASPLQVLVPSHLPSASQHVPLIHLRSESKSPFSFLSTPFEPAYFKFDDSVLPFHSEFPLENVIEHVKEMRAVGPSQLAHDPPKQDLVKVFENLCKDCQGRNLLPSDPEFTDFLQNQRTKIQKAATNGEFAQKTFDACWNRVILVQKAILSLDHHKALSQSQSPRIWQIGRRAIIKLVMERSSFETDHNIFPHTQEMETWLKYLHVFSQALFEFWAMRKDETFGKPEQRCEWFALAFLREVTPPYYVDWETARFARDLDDATRKRLMRELFQIWKFDKLPFRKLRDQLSSATGTLFDIQGRIQLIDYFRREIRPNTIPIEFRVEYEIYKMIANPEKTTEQIERRITAWARILPSISKSQDTWPRELGKHFFGLLAAIFARNVYYQRKFVFGDALVLVNLEVEKTLERMVQVFQVLWSHAYAQHPALKEKLTKLMGILPNIFPFDETSLNQYRVEGLGYLVREVQVGLGNIYLHPADKREKDDIADVAKKLYKELSSATDLFDLSPPTTVVDLSSYILGNLKFKEDHTTSVEDHLSSGVQAVLPIAYKRPGSPTYMRQTQDSINPSYQRIAHVEQQVDPVYSHYQPVAPKKRKNENIHDQPIAQRKQKIVPISRSMSRPHVSFYGQIVQENQKVVPSQARSKPKKSPHALAR
ncbi:hypothetical protein CROQUDRAFT_697193 [Cronartium quercuum f. sp. fusiforme G11]|uniref:Uncharacterized protein n=1 Tax=Cronartium quercuum f. sp. fusiforme G11 TaxID=708437 RepID=A0A9P6TDK4_9BASI|nr:hypothetical protein CROQUDRAFT_697193 [Cronartium quercuum f. sp. fusiforme G11]